jgi:hypothetical protein
LTGKLILTDIDETVLRFCQPFTDFTVEQGMQTYGDLNELYHLEGFLGTDRPGADRALEVFEVDHGRRQPAEPHARPAISDLWLKGYSFVGISACGLDPEFRAARLVNLHNELGIHFDAMFTVERQGSKREVLSRFRPAIWVEDHPGHARDGAELGHRVFLIDKPFNRYADPEGVTRVRGWDEILEILTAEGLA